ncbi:MAG TPA: hypothetical protein VEI83_15705 [Acidimicrobiales bacterium]|nr:hypothetical protein [Acidimicrobiales bacterium]
MVRKVVASLLVAGSLTLAPALFPGAAGAAPKAGCTGAAATLARLRAQEAAESARLATLEGQVAQALGAGKTHRAHELQEQVAVLTKMSAWLASQVSSLLARCPGVGSTGGGTTIVA